MGLKREYFQSDFWIHFSFTVFIKGCSKNLHANVIILDSGMILFNIELNSQGPIQRVDNKFHEFFFGPKRMELILFIF